VLHAPVPNWFFLSCAWKGANTQMAVNCVNYSCQDLIPSSRTVQLCLHSVCIYSCYLENSIQTLTCHYRYQKKKLCVLKPRSGDNSAFCLIIWRRKLQIRRALIHTEATTCCIVAVHVTWVTFLDQSFYSITRMWIWFFVRKSLSFFLMKQRGDPLLTFLLTWKSLIEGKSLQKITKWYYRLGSHDSMDGTVSLLYG
jgi:hypothetical protein